MLFIVKDSKARSPSLSATRKSSHIPCETVKNQKFFPYFSHLLSHQNQSQILKFNPSQEVPVTRFLQDQAPFDFIFWSLTKSNLTTVKFFHSQSQTTKTWLILTKTKQISNHRQLFQICHMTMTEQTTQMHQKLITFSNYLWTAKQIFNHLIALYAFSHLHIHNQSTIPALLLCMQDLHFEQIIS